MSIGRVHIVGAGLSGLAAALQLALAGQQVTLYEAAPFAGGRCRSFHDRDLDYRIDNGNHLIFSGNVAVQDYLHLTNALETIGGPQAPVFPFFDVASGERWTIRMNRGRIPWWLLDSRRRIPGTTMGDAVGSMLRMAVSDKARVAESLDPKSLIYKRFWEPLTIGALNTEMEHASSELLANVLGQSFAAGGAACVPLIPKIGLSESFIDPAIALLQQHGVEILYNHRLRSLDADGKRVMRLDFGAAPITVMSDDWVVLALPVWAVQGILPDVVMPNDFRSIISAHFRVDGVKDEVGFCGFVGGLAEWVFVRDGIVSVTVSCAERYGDYPVRDMAAFLWQDVARLYGLSGDSVPPHRIFKEKNATIAATPEQNARRPNAYIGWDNLALAGEWTNTGLPSTIEGAIRSGFKAAQVVMRWS